MAMTPFFRSNFSDSGTDCFELYRGIYGYHQIKPLINAHNHIDFVFCTQNDPQFVDDKARTTGSMNPAYSQ